MAQSVPTGIMDPTRATVTQGFPDLQVILEARLGVVAPNPTVRPYRLDTLVTNIGNWNSPPTQIAISLPKKGAWPFGLEIWRGQLGSMAPGQRVWVSHWVQVYLPEGCELFRVIVDPDDTFMESNKYNNLAERTLC
jgi:hypothetical protein